MIYDYECTNSNCKSKGSTVERITSSAKADRQMCEHCGEKLTRKFATTSIPKHTSWSSWQSPV